MLNNRQACSGFAPNERIQQIRCGFDDVGMFLLQTSNRYAVRATDVVLITRARRADGNLDRSSDFVEMEIVNTAVYSHA